MRIASLLASATEIVYAIGLGDQLVAISHECDYPPEALDKPRISRPRFDPAALSSAELDRAVRRVMAEHGSVYELDGETLRRVRPDLMLTQAVCDVCAVPTSLARDASRALDGKVRILSLDAHTIKEVVGSVRAVGRAAGAGAATETVAGALESRMTAVARAVRGASRPRVLAIEWLDPPFVPGHWVPEMIELAGGACLAGETAVPSKEVPWDDLVGLDPDVLLIMPCGYKLDQTRADADRYAEQLEAVAPRAVAERRAWVLNGSDYFNRSGPRTVDGIEILGGVLHPERMPDRDFAGKADVWQPLALKREGG